MSQIIELLSLSFMHRALIGGMLIAVVTSLLGILVVLRKGAFYGDAIAHASLTGVALGLVLQFNPLLTAMIYAIIIAIALPMIQRLAVISIDSILGFILPFSMGLGVLLLSALPGYQPDLISYLFGNILAISWENVAALAILSLIIVLLTILLKQKLIFAAFDPDYAKIIGLPVTKLDMLYHLLLAITIVTGIYLVGVILVNALLVIPVSITRLFARTLNQLFIATPLVAMGLTIGSILLSAMLDLSTGPTIAVVSGLVFIVMIGFKRFIH